MSEREELTCLAVTVVGCLVAAVAVWIDGLCGVAVLGALSGGFAAGIRRGWKEERDERL